ncbi:MAG: GAF domain-containing SpoIIE family protein phosphatase [Chloroflexota bacterium]|nr:GAF domain-containing SpoIIE family protein phosphatase [Chloroflexota bacterium]
MSVVALKKLIDPKNGNYKVLIELSHALNESFSIEDEQGNLLFGTHSPLFTDKLPVTYEEHTIGWVFGKDKLSPIAALLNFLVRQETEKRSLGSEVLDRYRELNMFYTLSENLASSLRMDTIANIALEEACRLNQITDGIIVLINEEGNEFRPVAVHGSKFRSDRDQQSLNLFTNQILDTGKTEIISDLAVGIPFNPTFANNMRVIGIPLKSKDRIFGAMIMAGNRIEQFTAGEIKLLNSIAHQTAPFVEIGKLSQTAVENARIERELQMAQQVQIDLLPKSVPDIEGWSFAAFWRPAREVAGDFYKFIPTHNGMLDLVIADVADKGMPAALFMALTSTALQANLGGSNSLETGITKTNQLVCLESTQGLFVTLFIARINPITGEIFYVNAGHNPPLLFSQKEDHVSSLNRTGFPLGLVPDAKYKQCATRMEPNDCIIFYTDGVTEAFDEDGNQFETKGLLKVISDHTNDSAEEILEAIITAVNKHIGSMPLSDDMAIVVVKRS